MAKTDVETLVISLEANVKNYEKSLERARREMDSKMGQIEKRVQQSVKTTGASFTQMGQSILGASRLIAGSALVASVAMIAGEGRKAAREIANISNEARRAGAGLKAFQEMAYISEQTRIGMDSLTDGIKELNIRADEFIATGKGSGEEAFKRLGYGAEELAEKIKDPIGLLAEIVDRTRLLDRAAQTRIFDEIFGGTGGEQMVVLLDRGAEGVRQMQREANEFGRVLSDDLIRRADELDKKLNSVGARMGQNIKSVLVEVLSFIDDWTYSKYQAHENWSPSNIRDAISNSELELAKAKETIGTTRRFFPDNDERIAEQEQWIYRVTKRLEKYRARLEFMEGGGGPARPSSDESVGGRSLGADTSDPQRYLASRLAAGRDLEHVERLSSAFAGKLTKMLGDMPAELRDKVQLNSGYRSPERQQQLWVEAVRKYGSEDAARKWVAPPGRSQHNHGNAADIGYGGSDAARQWMHANARKYGLTFPLANENWHIEDLDARRSQIDKDREEDMSREIQAIEKKTQLRKEQEKAYAEINAEAERYIANQALESQAVGLTEQQAAALRHTQELLNEAQRAGIEITPELERNFRSLGEGMAAADVNADNTRKRFEELNDTAAFFGSEMTDALSGLITGTTTAEQAMQQLYQTLVRATLQAALLGEGPLASLFGGSGGGGLTKGIGSILGGLFGGGSSAGASATGAGIYHAGGIVGAGGASRTVPAGLFGGAPRYHSGGIAGLRPDEIPAILQRGEGVVSRANMMAAAVAGRGGGGSAPTVNVNNFGPTTPEVQVSRSGGSYSIDVVVPALENAMAARASRGHGNLGKAVTSSATGRTLRG